MTDTWQTYGSTDMKTALTLRVASTTTRGRSRRRAGSCLPRWIVTSSLQKVTSTRTLLMYSVTDTLRTGYKEYKTDRTYMARMGNWRDNKDVEIPLDGIGGVNIVVKADVHRSGTRSSPTQSFYQPSNTLCRHQLPMLRLREPSRDRRLRQDGAASGLRRLRSAQLRSVAH